LRDHQLTKLARELLTETGLSPSGLVVEITESVMMEQSDLVNDVLTGMRDLGVRLSVDDFGTGYSSLSYLSRYPVTGVKIDRAFVDGLGDVPGDEAIVRAVKAMASALNLGVVAEGVETVQQRNILRKMGIQHGQGWLWGHAEAPETFELLWGPPTREELQTRDAALASAGTNGRVAPLPRGLAEAVAEVTASGAGQTEEANS